jgi:hypothetical protein
VIRPQTEDHRHGASGGWIVVGCLLLGCFFRSGDVLAQVRLPAPQPAMAVRSPFVLVARRGWHIDIGFAVEELAPPLSSLVSGFPGVRYVLIGFGDRRYLTAKHRYAPVMLRALWPGPGMLLVTALRASPAAAFPSAHVVEVSLPLPALLQIQSFVWQSLSRDAQTALVTAAEGRGPPAGLPGPYPGSIFLASRDTYSALHTCNTWVAEALGEAGMPVHSEGVVFAAQLWTQVKTIRGQHEMTAATLP